ncbi:endonuclease [Marinilabiliaceae bacterium JC017]|nr:endonuclease [Marinilabiliaceae bacterium JC017]
MRQLLPFVILSLFVLVACQRVGREKGADSRINYGACVVPGQEKLFEIATLNLKEFPVDGDSTIEYVAALVKQLDVDVIALQEIESADRLKQLIDVMEGWEGLFSPVKTWSMSLAYIYKRSEVSLDASSVEALFTDDHSAFPRPPFKINVTHLPTGINCHLINIHLKCCSGEENETRRRKAAIKLKRYMDRQLPQEYVVLLGDFNDRIDQSTTAENVFFDFITDSGNYRFADMAIAKGSSDYWSFPGWPSHLDHILITNEWFSRVDTTYTLRPDVCVDAYLTKASDHRPVVMVVR